MQLTIQLQDEIYQCLNEWAVAEQKTPEQLATECLTATLNLQSTTPQKKPVLGKASATEIGAKFVASWGGRFLRLVEPMLDSKNWIWQIPLFVPNPATSSQGKNPVSGDKVGILQIDAQTGEVLTRYTEIKAIFGEIQSKLGIQSLPKAQQDRLHYLLDRNREERLNAQQRQELDALMEAADALELDNLKRLPNLTAPSSDLSQKSVRLCLTNSLSSSGVAPLRESLKT